MISAALSRLGNLELPSWLICLPACLAACWLSATFSAARNGPDRLTEWFNPNSSLQIQNSTTAPATTTTTTKTKTTTTTDSTRRLIRSNTLIRRPRVKWAGRAVAPVNSIPRCARRVTTASTTTPINNCNRNKQLATNSDASAASVCLGQESVMAYMIALVMMMKRIATSECSQVKACTPP